MKFDTLNLADHVNKGQTLPSHLYTDAEVFEYEKDVIFRKEWLPVARIDQIPNSGDYLIYDLFGDEIVVIRDNSGTVNAFSNVCLHRGCAILEDRGHIDSNVIACPYHKWSYELDSKFRGAPFMDRAEDFDRTDMRLPRVCVEQWQGWIFINIDPGAEPLASQLTQLGDRLSPWNFSDLKLIGILTFDSAWNWKIMVENFLESYHHAATHPKTLNVSYPGKGTYAEQITGNYLLLENPSIDKDTIAHFWAGCILPFTLFSLVRDEQNAAGTWYQMLIDDQGHFRLHIHLLANEAMANDEVAIKEYTELVTRIHLEDIPRCEGVWKGV
ncbi:MAG: aromatic ring-hydroxylating dioxygenase subunit alpha, partial [Gammaproteobacteria bacterium]|nr:aromatic ring-hydroxylating dioxygenase subunit alpha [Gammaproteobacteria bacterium]